MARKMSKKEVMDLAWAKTAHRLPPHNYGPRKGLEGPFQYASGKVLYWDPQEGKYWDPGSDFYMDDDEALAHIMAPSRRENPMARRRKTESPGERRSIKISASNYTSFPKQVQTAYKAGVRDANKYGPKTVRDFKRAKRSTFSAIRAKGTERSQDYLNEPNKYGQAYRAGIRDTLRGESDRPWPIEMRSDYVMRGGEWVRMNSRRRNQMSTSEERRARKMILAIRGGDVSAAPERLASFNRSGKDYTWTVETANRATYEYRISKLASGYVVKFRKIRPSKGKLKYISPGLSASADKSYYRTAKEAGGKVASHIASGRHIPFRNPCWW